MKNLISPLFMLLLLSLLSSPTFADVDQKGAAKYLFQQKIKAIYKQALLCTPLEQDPKSSLNVTDWILLEPTAPNWWLLTQLQSTAKAASRYASKQSGSDKVLHCLAGCYIAKKLDYTSAVMVGWLKELSDASDCSMNTHFEKNDYEATIAGAVIGQKPRSCEGFCQRTDIKILDGDDMLEAARRE